MIGSESGNYYSFSSTKGLCRILAVSHITFVPCTLSLSSSLIIIGRSVAPLCLVQSRWGRFVLLKILGAGLLVEHLQHYLVEKQDLLAQEIVHLARERLVESKEQLLAGGWNLLALKRVRSLMVPTQPLDSVLSFSRNIQRRIRSGPLRPSVLNLYSCWGVNLVYNPSTFPLSPSQHAQRRGHLMG